MSAKNTFSRAACADEALELDAILTTLKYLFGETDPIDAQPGPAIATLIRVASDKAAVLAEHLDTVHAPEAEKQQ